MNTLVIGFGYKARSGKDSCVKTLVETFKDQYDVRRYAYADELKREVNEVDQREWCSRLGIEYDENPDRTDPFCQTEHGKQVKLLQFWGTEYRRAEDAFYSVKKLARRIAEESPQIAVISDLRFLNEFFWIKAMGGFTVKVTRHGFIDPTGDATHQSEVELDGTKFDYEITCMDGEVDQLRKDAVTVFNMIVDSMQPEIPELPYAIVQG